MIVTCPNCEARYAVDPLAIGPSGRTVQCARCDHRWFQKVESSKSPPDLVIRPPKDGPSLPVPVASKAEPRWGKRVAIVGVVLLLVATVGAGAYLYRDKVLEYRDKLLAYLPSDLHVFKPTVSPHPSSPQAPAPVTATPPAATTPAAVTPPAATPPAAAPPAATPPAATPPATAPPTNSSTTAAPPAGTSVPRLQPPPPPAPAQLEVDLSASRIELVDGRYVVHGEIANRGGSAGSITKLVVTFKKGNDVLGTRTYPLTLGPIAAGERMTFSQTLDNPPAGATDIVPSVE